MKRVLIIYPHFPPSNLAGTHRARLFAQHLPSFGWEPVILTINEKFYEETNDDDLVKLLPQGLRIEKVSAYTRIGPIGDIGLRGFLQLYKKAKELIKKEYFEFLYIPIPSFYCAILGRLLHASTGIKYGIDYIDPWVHTFPGSEKVFSRHWFSTKLAKFLEPIAIKKATLVTGVAEGYYKPVLERNSHLFSQAITGAMPYGGEENDHAIAATLQKQLYLFKKDESKLQFVYAGAMLPKAYEPLEEIFKAIAINKNQFDKVEFHFIGTGKRANDPLSFNIKPLAEKYGLWNSVVFEYPKRISYFDVIVHLNAADAIFILGSTEPHYTPSKVYQAILAERPILAVLHEQSTASDILKESNAGVVITINELNIAQLKESFPAALTAFKEFIRSYKKEQVYKEVFADYSAFAVTQKLSFLLEKACLK